MKSWVNTAAAVAVSAFSVAFSAPSLGATFQVDSNAQGWVESGGSSNGAYDGNNTWTANNHYGDFNSWASFDLAGVTGSISSAVLHLKTSYYDFTGPVSVSVYDVTTPFSAFQNNSEGLAGYSDLQTGNLYAQFSVNPGNNVDVTLSGQALQDITAAEGHTFMVGYHLLTPNAGFYTNGDSATGVSMTLTSAVPEPESYAMMLAGLGALGFMGRRRKAGAALSA